MIDASQFLALAALKRGSVTVEGQELAIREMNVAERAELIRLSKEDPAKGQMFVVKSCLLNGAGESLLSESDIAQVAPKVVDEISAAILKLSGLIGDDSKNA